MAATGHLLDRPDLAFHAAPPLQVLELVASRTVELLGEGSGGVELVGWEGEDGIEGGHVSLLSSRVWMERTVTWQRPASIGGVPYFVPPFSNRAAYAAASVRVRTPSLESSRLTWCSTVFALMNRRAPISALVRP